MVNFGEGIQYIKEIIIPSFGISNIDLVNFVFNMFLSSFIFGWFSLFTFIILRKRESIQNWKIPNFINLSAILILGIVGYIVSYLFLSNFNLFIMITGGENTSLEIIPILLFMGMYIIFSLILISEKRKVTDSKDDLLPPELKIFITKSIPIIIGLLFISLAQSIFLDVLKNTPNILSSYVIQIIASIFFFLIGLIFCLTPIYPDKMIKFSNFVNMKIKRNPCICFIIFGGLIFLLVVDKIIKTNIIETIPTIILFILITSMGIFFKYIKRILTKLKNLSPSLN